MKISIALCTFNGEKYLKEQLQSFAAQTRLPDELVVCDDRSQDMTVDIIRDFAATAPFPVRLYVNETNLRVIKNFEKAISLCEGDIIALSDQDDVWLDEKLKIFEEVFEAKPHVGLVFCDADLVDENLCELGYSNWELSNFDYSKLQLFSSKASFEKSFMQILSKPTVWGCMMAFRAKYKTLVLPFPTDIPIVLHDWWMSWLIYATSYFEPVPERLVKYRQHSAQQCGQQASESNVQRSLKVIEILNTRNDFEVEIKKLTSLLERLRFRKKDFEVSDTIKFIESYLPHIINRQKMHRGNVSSGKRIRLITEDLLTLRYHRYSRGLKSAVKDLLLR
jgi:glycosyltransferase involved in cell wall biosynthesis